MFVGARRQREEALHATRVPNGREKLCGSRAPRTNTCFSAQRELVRSILRSLDIASIVARLVGGFVPSAPL